MAYCPTTQAEPCPCYGDVHLSTAVEKTVERFCLFGLRTKPYGYQHI
jgi:hypothetical protein